MRVSEKSILKAKLRKSDDEALRLCLNYLVCPKCGGDLITANFPSYKYQCEKCTFTFTGEQEAELITREEKSC